MEFSISAEIQGLSLFNSSNYNNSMEESIGQKMRTLPYIHHIHEVKISNMEKTSINSKVSFSMKLSIPEFVCESSSQVSEFKEKLTAFIKTQYNIANISKFDVKFLKL